jgi:hypothetical protein
MDGPATAQTQKRSANSVGSGQRSIGLSSVKNERNGLVHRNGSHLIKEPLGTTGLKEGAAGAAGMNVTIRRVKKKRAAIFR